MPFTFPSQSKSVPMTALLTAFRSFLLHLKTFLAFSQRGLIEVILFASVQLLGNECFCNCSWLQPVASERGWKWFWMSELRRLFFKFPTSLSRFWNHLFLQIRTGITPMLHFTRIRRFLWFGKAAVRCSVSFNSRICAVIVALDPDMRSQNLTISECRALSPPT
jgi:hypothetical protein